MSNDFLYKPRLMLNFLFIWDLIMDCLTCQLFCFFQCYCYLYIKNFPVHAQVFKQSLKKVGKPGKIPGHPIYTFIEEKILYPASSKKLNDREWAEIKMGEPEI